MIRLKLHLLGSFEASLADQPLNGFRSNKTRALLAYLVTEGNRTHPRESLGTLLWGSYNQEAARLSLRVALANLRQILAPVHAPSGRQAADSSPFLTITRQTVQVDLGSHNCWVDLAEFDALWSACETHLHQDLASCPACVQRMAALIELYRGDLLEGLVLPDCPEFDEWRLLRQEAYHRQAMTALQILSRFYTGQQRYEQAEHYARRRIALEPWREETHRHLMQILADRGQRGAALAQYKACEQILKDELGAEPDEQTTALYRKLCSGYENGSPAGPARPLALPRPARPSPVAPPSAIPWPALAPITFACSTSPQAAQPELAPPDRILTASADLHNMPLQLSPFFGRETELARLSGLLLDPDYRLVSLVGPGGVGKTRLALAAAEQVLHEFAGGGWFVPLADLAEVQNPTSTGPGEGRADPSPQNSLARAIGQALALPFSASSEPRTQLVEYLGQRPVLLLLDGLECLVDECADYILEILRRAPHTTLLVTALGPLNLQAEVAMRVNGLPVPDLPIPADDPDALAEPANMASLRLFAERAARRPVDFALTPETLPDVVQICQLVEGLPLGIELAAAQIEDATPAEIARAIGGSLDILSTSMRDVPRRHQSLQAVFDNAWRLLGREEQIVLARVSVFRGSFDPEAALEILSGPGPHPAGIAPFDVARVLDALVGKSQLGQTTTGRFQVHELLRRFAAEKLSSLGGGGSMRDRHSSTYLGLLRKFTSSLWGPNPLAAYAQIQQEWENIEQAWLWAASQAHAAALESCVPALGRYLALQGLFEKGEHLLTQAGRALAGGEELALRGQLLAARARLANAQAQSQRAAGWAKQSLALAVTAGDMGLEGQARLQWGIALARLGKRQTARTQLEMVLAYAESEIELQAATCIELGHLASQGGHWNQAEANLDRGLALARKSEGWDSTALALLRLSDVAWQQGAQDRASRCASESLAIYRNLGDRQGISEALNNVGLAALLSGDYGRATNCFTEYLATAQERGDQRTTGLALSNLGHTAYVQGDYREAATYFQEALRLCKTRGFRHLEANVLAALGMVYTALGDAGAAWDYLRQGLSELAAFGLVPAALNALVGVAWLQSKAGDQLRAAELLGLALKHPALAGDVRQDTVEPILMELSGALPASQLDAALARGEALTLEATVSSLLAEGNQPN